MRLLRHLLPCALMFFACLAPALADDLVVSRVKDTNTLLLSNDTSVRLYGVQAPQGATEQSKAWPLHGKALTFLQQMVEGKKVTLNPAPTPTDRAGRMLAEVVLADKESVQSKMIKAGMARVYTTAENPQIATTLYPLEEKARAEKRGIWALDAYAVRTPDNAAQYMDRFEIVEGKVLEVATVDGVAYLNFGDDWKTDFTVSIDSGLARAIAAETLLGDVIRVRGWMHSHNGPMITVTHAQQIEVVSGADIPEASEAELPAEESTDAAE